MPNEIETVQGDVADLYTPYLLPSESLEEYRSLQRGLVSQLRPSNFIEHLLVADIAQGEHHKRRLLRAADRIIRFRVPEAIQNLLKLALDLNESAKIDDLAQRWFSNKSKRRKT